jgi:hypothetical protein
MTDILYHFLHHLGWGMLLSLMLIPPRLIARSFYLVNLAAILGLWATALALRADGRWAALDPWTLAASLLLLASAFVPPDRFERILLALFAVAAAIAAVSIWEDSRLLAGDEIYNSTVFLWFSFVLSGLLAGATMVAMILGHYYLVTPELSFGLLGRFTWFIGILMALRVLLMIVPLSMGDVFARPEGAHAAIFFVDHLAFLMQRLLSLVFLALLVPMVADCVKRRANQSATGLLYVASFLALMGEGVAIYFTVSYGLPL